MNFKIANILLIEQQNVSRYEYKVLQLYVKIFALEISAPLRQSLKHDIVSMIMRVRSKDILVLYLWSKASVQKDIANNRETEIG